jgi:hypothetical protein
MIALILSSDDSHRHHRCRNRHRDVKEMIGGYEYWAREGYPIENDRGPIRRATDELTAPLNTITRDC